MGHSIMKEGCSVARSQVKQCIVGHSEKWRICSKYSGKPRRISKRVGFRDLTEMSLKKSLWLLFCGEWIERGKNCRRGIRSSHGESSARTGDV